MKKPERELANKIVLHYIPLNLESLEHQGADKGAEM